MPEFAYHQNNYDARREFDATNLEEVESIEPTELEAEVNRLLDSEGDCDFPTAAQWEALRLPFNKREQLAELIATEHLERSKREYN